MKKLLSVFIVLLSLLLVLSAAADIPDELPENHQFYEEMTYLIEKGVLQKDRDGELHPDKLITRAEAAVMVGRLKGLDDTKKATRFFDVPRKHYASGFIAETVKAGYFKGYKGNSFRPNAPITRGDAAVIMEQVFDLTHTFNQPFKDVRENAYYAGAISKILAANIAIGYPDNTFRPRQKMTLGEFSAFLARALEPEFKNDAVIARSYQKDKTKTYSYSMSDGTTAIHRFEDVPDRGELRYGFMWTVEVDGDSYEYFEFESYEFFAFGYPYSEYIPALVYPVQLGKTFNTGLGDETFIHTITGVNKTIETPYRTFTNAVEVTTQEGFKYYMVEGFAVVKSINPQGVIENELVSVE
ncbi:S-layer homology domain-containing protein [Planococcus sp. X10-3]|uniref:S-layer homology domain-containing protein n=1 Tax=Planococcus sp. X10-3 TaxID=3061240 RepID=UPI003BAF3F84